MLWTLTLNLVHFDFCLLLPYGVVISSLFTILFSALFGVSPPWFRCLIHLFLLCFITSTLLLLTCLFSCARYFDELSCFACFVFHFICGTQFSLLVRLIWSHLYEPSWHFCMLCLSCIVLQALYMVVSITHHL